MLPNQHTPVSLSLYPGIRLKWNTQKTKWQLNAVIRPCTSTEYLKARAEVPAIRERHACVWRNFPEFQLPVTLPWIFAICQGFSVLFLYFRCFASAHFRRAANVSRSQASRGKIWSLDCGRRHDLFLHPPTVSTSCLFSRSASALVSCCRAARVRQTVISREGATRVSSALVAIYFSPAINERPFRETVY